MKILLTLAYLVAFCLFLFLANQQQKLQIQQIRGRSGIMLKNYLIIIAVLVMNFAQYWILTGSFPLPLVLLLVAASTLSTLIVMVIGSIAGFTLEEKKKKINALSVIWGAQRPILGCAYLGASLLMLIALVIGNLWTFWSHPYGDPNALVWIAFFQFGLPQIVTIPFSIILLWPIVTSEYLDDDLRNSHLATGFSAIFFQTILILFPAWLFKKEIVEVFQVELPSFWILLSIPILLFIFGSLLPFFIGLYRFRSQARLMISWREKWLQEVLESVKLPMGELRNNAIDEKLERLHGEITRRFSQNKLFHYYQEVVSPKIDDDKLPLPEPEAVPALPQAGDPGAPPADSQALKTDEGPDILTSIRIAKDSLTQGSAPQDVGDAPLANIHQIINENRANLVNWDIRFEHLNKLLQLYEIGLEGKTKDISGFIEARLENISKAVAGLTSKRNLLAGVILSGISSAIVWAFNTFQSEIIELIGKLSRMA